MVTALQCPFHSGWGEGWEMNTQQSNVGETSLVSVELHENKTCPKMSQKWIEIWLVMWHVSLQKEELHLPLKNTRINNSHLLIGHRQVQYFSHLPLNFPEAVKSKVSVLIHELALAEKKSSVVKSGNQRHVASDSVKGDFSKTLLNLQANCQHFSSLETFSVWTVHLLSDSYSSLPSPR